MQQEERGEQGRVCGARLDVAAPAIVGRQEHYLRRAPR
jgi:hypothetical protein